MIYKPFNPYALICDGLTQLEEMTGRPLEETHPYLAEMFDEIEHGHISLHVVLAAVEAELDTIFMHQHQPQQPRTGATSV